MDNFTPESLQNFIQRKRPAKAEELDRLIQERKRMRQNPPQGPSSPQPENSAVQHDAEIRKHLGALVQELLQNGHHDELRAILTEHHNFILDIMRLLDQNQPR